MIGLCDREALVNATLLPQSPTVARPLSRRLRSVRPSLLDLRFTGDPWVVPQPDGTASLCLDDYQLLHVQLSPLDVPSFNRTVLGMRHLQARRCHK